MLRNRILLSSFVVGLALITACGNRKEVVTTEVVEVTDAFTDSASAETYIFEESEMSYGTVKDYSTNEGCGFVIEITKESGELWVLEPFELDEQFQKDGQKIKFSFTPSRRPSECLKASTPININTIEAI